MEDLGIQKRKKKRQLLESQESLQIDEVEKRRIEVSPKKGGIASYMTKDVHKSQESEKKEPKVKVNIAKSKIIPKGKKRVVKNRMIEDANGYTVVEDYSSMEDMTPAELEAANQPKQPKKQAKITDVQPAKPASAAPLKQGGLNAFFAKKK